MKILRQVSISLALLFVLSSCFKRPEPPIITNRDAIQYPFFGEWELLQTTLRDVPEIELYFDPYGLGGANIEGSYGHFIWYVDPDTGYLHAQFPYHTAIDSYSDRWEVNTSDPNYPVFMWGELYFKRPK